MRRAIKSLGWCCQRGYNVPPLAYQASISECSCTGIGSESKSQHECENGQKCGIMVLGKPADVNASRYAKALGKNYDVDQIPCTIERKPRIEIIGRQFYVQGGVVLQHNANRWWQSAIAARALRPEIAHTDRPCQHQLLQVQLPASHPDTSDWRYQRAYAQGSSRRNPADHAHRPATVAISSASRASPSCRPQRSQRVSNMLERG